MPEPPGRDPLTITLGTASFDVRHGRVTTEVNKPDTASGTVPADDIKRSPAEWATPAEVAIASDVLTSGQVVEALPESDGSVALSLRSGVELDEGLMPAMVCQNLTPGRSCTRRHGRLASLSPTSRSTGWTTCP